MKYALAVNGSIVLLALAGSYLVWNQVPNALATWRQQGLQQSQLAEWKLRNEQLRESVNQQTNIDRLFGQMLPDNLDTVQTIGQLEALASSLGVTLTFENINEDQQASPVAELSYLRILFRAAGTASDLLAFLDALEHQAKLGEIVTWELNRSAGSSGHELSVELGYYFRNAASKQDQEPVGN